MKFIFTLALLLVSDALEEKVGLEYESVCNGLKSCTYTTSCSWGNNCPRGTMKKGETKGDCWMNRHVNLCCKHGTNKPNPPEVKTWGGTAEAKGSKCVFPFTWKGKTYCECTEVDHPRPWCHTKEDSSEWGNCVVAEEFALTQVHHIGKECGTAVAVMTEHIDNHYNCVKNGDHYERYKCKPNGKMIIQKYSGSFCSTKFNEIVKEEEVTSGTCMDRNGYSVKYFFDCKGGAKQRAPALSGSVIGFDNVFKKDVTGSECPGTGGTVDKSKSSTSRFVPGTCMTTGAGSVKYECSTFFGHRAIATKKYSDSACTAQDGKPETQFGGCTLFDGDAHTTTLIGCSSVEEDAEHAVSNLLIDQNKKLKELLLEMK